MMRWLAFLVMAALLLVAPNANAQAPAPGCRAPLHPDLIGRAENLDYVVTDTAGLNVVLVHVFGQTTLSDRMCLPDAAQGTLSVVVNYGATSDTAPEEQASEMVFGTLARREPHRRPAEFPPIATEAVSINGMRGAEAVSHDTIASGDAVFRYALVFVFPDGAKGLVSASGPDAQLADLRPTLRRIAAGLRPRRNVQEMQQHLVGAVDDMFARLRGPIVDQALDACLGGVPTREAAITRATALGFPAFQAEPTSRGGENWMTSAAPANDSGRVRLALMERPSRMMAGRTSLTCAIVAPAPLAALLQQKFDARFSGAGAERMFTLADGQVRAAQGSVRGANMSVGSARLETSAEIAAISIEITPLN